MESRIHKRVSTSHLENIFICHITAVAHTDVCLRAYLENFHGQLAHSGLVEGRCNMDGGDVLGAVVQKVPGSPLSSLPVLLTLAMDKHRLLSDPDL